MKQMKTTVQNAKQIAAAILVLLISSSIFTALLQIHLVHGI